jgi:hypothetical protein
MSLLRWFPIAMLAATASAQSLARPAATPGPMLNDGTLTLDTPAFTLKLVKSSQTVAALQPKADPKFDFTPGDLLSQRSQNGYYHLGDLDLRIRTGASGPWVGYSGDSDLDIGHGARSGRSHADAAPRYASSHHAFLAFGRRNAGDALHPDQHKFAAGPDRRIGHPYGVQ